MIGNTLLEFKFVTSFSALGNINLVPDLLCYKAGLPLKKSKAKGGMKGYANFFLGVGNVPYTCLFLSTVFMVTKKGVTCFGITAEQMT